MKAIVILSFNRPHYLGQVLAGLKTNNLDGWDIILSQDGGINTFTGNELSSITVENECKNIFKVFFPEGKIVSHGVNYGPDFVYRLLYDLFHEYESLLFFDDDLVPSSNYVALLQRLNEKTKHLPEVGAITAYGPDRYCSYKEQLLGMIELEVAQPNWGFLVNRNQYLARKDTLEKYFSLLKNMDPRALNERLLLDEYFIPFGSKVLSTSVDTADTLAMVYNGQVKLTTKTRNATYIGKQGFHFTTQQYEDGYYGKDMFQNISTSSDIDFIIPSRPELQRYNIVLKEYGLV